MSDELPPGGVECCWICRGEDRPLLQNVCDCKGTLGEVHQRCIDEWVLHHQKTHCPSCGCRYNVIQCHGRLRFGGLDADIPRFSLYDKVLSESDLRAPGSLFGRIFFVTRYWLAPSVRRLLWFVSLAFIKFGFMPLIFGGLYLTPCYSPPPDAVADEDSNWWFRVTCQYVLGLVPIFLVRAVQSAWRQWNKYLALRCEAGAHPAHNHQSSATATTPFTFVEVTQDVLNRLLAFVHWKPLNDDEDRSDKACTSGFIQRTIIEIATIAPLSVLLGMPFSLRVATFVLIVAAVLCRLWRPLHAVRVPTRRLIETEERKHDGTATDKKMWFVTYMWEIVVFSIVLPIVGGYTLHYALGPQLVEWPPWLWSVATNSWTAADVTYYLLHVETLPITPDNVVDVVLHWVMGTYCLMTLVRYEASVIVALFHPGVDLFFTRSLDLHQDHEEGDHHGDHTTCHACWNFVMSQVFDADPLRVVFDFIRVSLIELPALALFVAFPVQAVFWLAQGLHSLSYIAVGEVYEGVPSFANHSNFPLKSGLFFDSLVNATAADGSSTVVPGDWWSYALSLSFYLCLLGTTFTALFVFPIQRYQLTYLRPLTKFFGAVVRLETFLFDKERLEILDAWLADRNRDELLMPYVPKDRMFVRRDRWIPKEELPTLLKLRLALFSMALYVVSTIGAWFFPIVVGTFVVTLVDTSLELAAISLSLPFLMADLSLFLQSFVQFAVVLLFLVFGGFVQLALWLGEWSMKIIKEDIAEQTREYLLCSTRQVGPLRAPS